MQNGILLPRNCPRHAALLAPAPRHAALLALFCPHCMQDCLLLFPHCMQHYLPLFCPLCIHPPALDTVQHIVSRTRGLQQNYADVTPHPMRTPLTFFWVLTSPQRPSLDFFAAGYAAMGAAQVCCMPARYALLWLWS
jgi:hypothetical protein